MLRTLYYKEIEWDQPLHNEFDQVKHFYIILRGSVGFQQRNPAIKNWAWAKKLEDNLKQWKSEEFDIRVKKEIQMYALRRKLVADTK